MLISLRPVAWIKNERYTPTDDNWGSIISEITLDEKIPSAAFSGIIGFSQLEVIYYFHKAVTENIVYSRIPRGNPAYPDTGIFAQRNKDRPNHIGLCTVELIWHRERTIAVKYLDAINGTPVLDIKPVFREFRLDGEISQPDWVTDLMKKYF